MTGPDSNPSARVLLYEPRIEGHHLVWLRFVAEDLLAAGRPITLAVDLRPSASERVRKRLAPLWENLAFLPVFGEAGNKIGGDGAGSVANCLERSGAAQVFLNTLDEIASPLFRKAALGKLPPPSLRGKMGGIYVRPRFLGRRGLSLNEWMKYFGFARLVKASWFNRLLFLDPWITDNCRRWFPQAPAFALPDPCPDDFAAAPEPARRHFAVPDARQVLLFYGGAYRRKGLHLAVEAFLQLPKECRAYLLCAGEQPDDSHVQKGLETLVRQGSAQIVSRYIFEEEEKLLFAASDAVLLPYVRHFGNSAVLSRAAGAGKMVIASDEELVGRLVREYNLGLLFQSGNPAALQQAIVAAGSATEAQRGQWRAGALAYAAKSSRAEFRRILQQSFQAPMNQRHHQFA